MPARKTSKKETCFLIEISYHIYEWKPSFVEVGKKSHLAVWQWLFGKHGRWPLDSSCCCPRRCRFESAQRVFPNIALTTASQILDGDAAKSWRQRSSSKLVIGARHWKSTWSSFGMPLVNSTTTGLDRNPAEGTTGQGKCPILGGACRGNLVL